MSALIPQPKPKAPVRQAPMSEEVNTRVVNKQLREVFREAFDRLGGADWLVQFALESDQNARVFVQAVSKLLPPNMSPKEDEQVIIDIPWLTRDRLEYKRVEDAHVISIK